jgi:hypothetical protein
MRISAFDVRSFGRCVAIGVAASAVLAAVLVSTQEASGSPAGLFARLAAMAPVVGAVSAAIALEQSRARGELVAVACLGMSPWRAQAGALAGAFVLGLAGAAMLGTQASGAEALLPHVQATQWQRWPDGAWFAAELGATLGPGAADLALVQPRAGTEGEQSVPRAAVVASIALAGLVLPGWACAPMGRAVRCAAGAVAALGAIASFHLVAAGRISPWALLAVPLALLAHVAAIAVVRADG